MEEIRMKQRVMALVLAGILAAAATACGSTGSTSGKNNDAKSTVAYKDMKVGETETDLKAYQLVTYAFSLCVCYELHFLRAVCV